MPAQPDMHLNAHHYFEQDADSREKLEYFNGQIVAQAGSSARHNLIVANLIGHLYAELRQRDCRVFPSDMRVQAIDQKVYTYPDLSIVCGQPRFSDPGEMTLINPLVIVEILSPSTEAHDRKEKFMYYRRIESLQEYILIDQQTPYVQRYSRQNPHFWYVHLTDDLAGQVTINSIGCTLAMQAIYEGITW